MSQKDIWIGDSGATSHMVCHDVGMFGCKPLNQQVIVGDGRSVKVLKTGNLKVVFHNRKGEKNEVLLEDVKFIPSLKVNLFSTLVALKKGATVRSEGTSPEQKEKVKVIPTSSVITRSKTLMDAMEDDSSSSEIEEGGFIMEESSGDPANFDEAWNNPLEFKRNKWREAVMKKI